MSGQGPRVTGSIFSPLLQVHHESLPEATPWDNVGFNIKNVSVKYIKSGYVTSEQKNKPASGVTDFSAQVIVLNHPLPAFLLTACLLPNACFHRASCLPSS